MLEVDPTGQRGRTITGSGLDANEAVAGAASEAFARRLHHRRALAELQSAGISFHRAIPCFDLFTRRLKR